MGGRGAYWSGASADYLTREFDAFDTAQNGKVKVLQKRAAAKNLHFPIYSNTPNTTYFVVDERDPSKIAVVGIYRQRRLVESVDLTDTRGPHWHRWHRKQDKGGNEIVVKERLDNFNLKPKHIKLLAYARDWENNRI